MSRSKKPKKLKKAVKMRVYIIHPDDLSSGKGGDDELGESGMFLDTEDVQVIYNALAAYKPAGEEKEFYELLTKQLPLIIAVGYNDPYFLEKGDVQVIYNALCAYKPTEWEELLHSTLLEWFEEILVVDYGEPYPDAN
jgi:hypothetical protein